MKYHPDINIIDWYRDPQITIIAIIEGHKYIDRQRTLPSRNLCAFLM